MKLAGAATFKTLGVMLLVCSLAGCAAHFTPESIDNPYGFLYGLWHGAIAFITVPLNFVSWVLGLFDIDLLRSVQIIGRPNTGTWYYVGFGIGVVATLGMGSSSS